LSNINLNSVLETIRPTYIEIKKIKELSSKLIEIINGYASKNSINAEAVLVGSVAKDTWFSGKADIDIFIKFPLDTSKEDLKKNGLELGYKCIEIMHGRSELRYASHPYVTGFIEGYEIDFVPCYIINGAHELKSAVDRTILHTEYIKKNLKENQKDEVLLLKNFMISIHTYGAEFKVGGFSGYLCELLIIYYSSFIEVLKAASEKWRPKTIIDIENHGSGEHFGEPMVVVDPTDENRNVSAALTLQKISEFIIASRKFVEFSGSRNLQFRTASRNFMQNSEEDYFQKTVDVNKESIKYEFRHRKTKILLIRFKPPEIPADAIYPQIKKTERSLRRVLERDDFGVFDTSSWTDEKENVIILLEFEVHCLPHVKKHCGPQIWSKRHQNIFVSKYGDKAYVEGDRWVAETERKYKNATVFLEDILAENNIGILRFGKHIKKEILKEHEIVDIFDFLDSERLDDDTLLFFYEYLHKNTYYGH